MTHGIRCYIHMQSIQCLFDQCSNHFCSQQCHYIAAHSLECFPLKTPPEQSTKALIFSIYLFAIYNSLHKQNEDAQRLFYHFKQYRG